MVANTADVTGSIYHERQVIIKYFIFSINNGTMYVYIYIYIHIHNIYIYIQIINKFLLIMNIYI